MGRARSLVGRGGVLRIPLEMGCEEREPRALVIDDWFNGGMKDEKPPHELFTFMMEVTNEMSAEYDRISSRTLEDPGTAGDDGEENWASLLRDFLPPQYHVETKGRILSRDGILSPQVDVLVLHPSYPGKLLKKKTYLASGVLAAFECKLTLRSGHIKGAFETASSLHDIQLAREGNPYDELHHSIIFGLLAHSHDWKKDKSEPMDNVQTSIEKAHNKTSRPCDIPDFVCVADLGTWTACKMTSAGVAMRDVTTGQLPEGLPPDVDLVPVTEYMRPVPVTSGEKTTPIGIMFTKLLSRLAFEEAGAKPIADYFRVAGLLGSGEGFTKRTWPPPYSPGVRARIPGSIVNDGSSRWGMAFL